jgi:hypothetical protein
MNVVFPAMVDATNAALFIPAKEKVCTTMGAKWFDQTSIAIRVTKEQ